MRIAIALLLMSSLYAQKMPTEHKDLQCANMAMRLTAVSIKNLNNKKGSFESLENLKNKKFGLKEIAELGPTWSLTKEYYKSFSDFSIKIGKMQEAKKSYKEIQEASGTFLKKSVKLLHGTAKTFMNDCYDYFDTTVKKCAEFQADEKSLQSCISYEGKEPMAKIMTHFQKNSIFMQIEKAEKIDDELEKSIKSGCPKDFDQTLAKRIEIGEVYFATILPKVFSTMIRYNSKECLNLFKNLEDQIKQDTFNKFVSKTRLFKHAIDHKSADALTYLSKEKNLKLNKNEKAEIQNYAKENNYSNNIEL
ncbi:hypothetical protein N9N67_05855 [Bacteriovoracaceae bacterium]|nr:hypothetical protein [Bacteriovoracaceae bacterium]